MKGVWKVALVVVLAVVILAAVVFFSLNAMIRKGVEEVGGRSLGVDVQLSQANLSIMGGKVALTNLRVSNPEGFSTSRLFETANASAAMQPSSLFQDEVVIDSIVIDSPSLTIEQSLHGTNMAAVLENVKGEEKAEEKAEEEREEKPKKQKLYRVKMLQINGAKVTFASFLSAKEPVTVQLPDIQLENISSADGTGVTLAQLFQKVFVKMTETALRTGQGVVPTEIMNDVTGQLGQFAPELAGGVGEKAKGAIEKAGETLKGIFQR